MDARPGMNFPSVLRLRHRREYLRVRERGKKLHTPNFLILVLENPGGPTRLGVTASRKVGGAVVRNRIKRLVREFFRTHYRMLPEGKDLSIIAKPRAASLDYPDVCRELVILRQQLPPAKT